MAHIVAQSELRVKADQGKGWDDRDINVSGKRLTLP